MKWVIYLWQVLPLPLFVGVWLAALVLCWLTS